MSVVIIIAISFLAVIFMASFVMLLVVCRQKCGKIDFAAERSFSSLETRKKDVELIGANMNLDAHYDPGGGLDSDEFFLDPDWQGDAQSLVSHCVTLLKICHSLTERLVAHTIESGTRMNSQETMNEIVAIAKQIGPKVDVLVKAMYTPADSRYIEEKSSELYLAVYLLLQVIKSASEQPENLGWADNLLYSIEQEIDAMRKESTLFGDYDPNLFKSSDVNATETGRKPTLCFVNRTFLS